MSEPCDDIVTYTTWAGSPIVYRHLPSGAVCFEAWRPRGRRWVVISAVHTVVGERASLGSALALMSRQPGDARDVTLNDISHWARSWRRKR